MNTKYLMKPNSIMIIAESWLCLLDIVDIKKIIQLFAMFKLYCFYHLSIAILNLNLKY